MAAINLRPSEFALAGHRIHYAWVIVAITSVMRLVSSSFRMGFPALIPLIAVEFGWQVWLVTLAFSLQWVVSGAFGPAAGWLGDRYGARVTMTIGATLYLVGMILTGAMSQPWHLILFFGIILSASMGIFQVPLTVSVTSWFRRHLGVGMGLLQGSQGLGPVIAIPIMLGIAAWFTVGAGAQFLNWGALSSPLLSWIPLGTPEILGIRMAFWIPGIVGGIILLLLIRIFYNTPEDIGLRQLGADANTPPRQAPATGATAKARATVFLRQVRKTPAFWNLIGIHYWGCAGHSIVIVFLPAMIISSLAPEGGWDSITDDSARSAALLRASAIGGGAAAVMSLVSTFTRFGVPIAADLLGSKWVMAVCFFLQVAPVLILLFGILFHPVIWMFYLFAVLFGIGFGGEMSAFPIINRQYYGNAPIGTSYGFQMMGAGAGMASGALVGSLLLAVTGGYAATAALSFVMSLIGVVSILFLPTTHQHQLPNGRNNCRPRRVQTRRRRRPRAARETGTDLSWPYQETEARFHGDLEIVRSLSLPTSEPGPPGLIILYGLPGSGKSYFAQLVAERCNAVVLNSDQNRRAIVEGSPLYDALENRRLFKALNRRVEELLDLGQVVVFDSTGLRDWIRNPLERIAEDRNLIPVRVRLDPPEEIILRRLDIRQPPPDPANDAKTWRDVYEWMLPGWQPIAEPHLNLVNPECVHWAVDTVRRLLAEQR